MMRALSVAKKYFEISNQGDLDAIANMFDDNATYSSENTGVYFGKTQIMDMVRPFYASFKTLNWQVHEVEETCPHVICFTGINEA